MWVPTFVNNGIRENELKTNRRGTKRILKGYILKGVIFKRRYLREYLRGNILGELFLKGDILNTNY